MKITNSMQTQTFQPTKNCADKNKYSILTSASTIKLSQVAFPVIQYSNLVGGDGGSYGIGGGSGDE